jgi:hypothetical protein
MSLMNLLSVGQSLQSVKPQGRYKVASQPTLPKFAPMERGISLSPAKTGQGEAAHSPSVPMDFFRQAKPADKQVPQPPAQAAVPSSAAVRSSVSQVKSATPSAEPKIRSKPWLDAWVRRHKTRTSHPLVQGELSIDAVRVVRNDLSEADLEIVPGKAAEPVVEPVRQPVEGVSESKQPAFKQYLGRLVSAVRSII